MQSREQQSDNKRMLKLVLFFFAMSFVLYKLESAHLRDAKDQRQDLLLIRDEGMTTLGRYSSDQNTRPNEYGRNVLVGNATIDFSINGETHTTSLDVTGGFDDPYYVRYLREDPKATFCWQGDESLGAVDSSIFDYTCRIAVFSVVFSAPGLFGLFLLACMLVNAYQARQ